MSATLLGLSLSAEQDRELYERARDAATEAEIEGRAQVQAAVEAAAALASRERQDTRAPSRATPQATSVRCWTLQFRDARLEAAYHRKCNTNCDNRDHVASLCRLWAAVPPLLLALSGFRLACGWPLASATASGFYMCVLCNLCLAVLCTLVFAVQLSFPVWYRSNRGTVCWWFASLLWILESLQLLVKADNLRVFIGQLIIPPIYMSFAYKLPYIIHLKLRAFGFGCQALAILVSANYRFAPWLLATSLIGHFVGILLIYFLDRRSRSGFLMSLPRWLLDDLMGDRSQAPSFQSYRSSLSRQMWHIFYPELFEASRDSLGSGMSSQRAEEPVSRRALGGFAGGFGGVSGLKCRSSSLLPLMSLSSNSISTESSSSSGNLVTCCPAAVGSSKVSTEPVFLPGYSAGRRGRNLDAASSSACSHVSSEINDDYIRFRGRQPTA